MSWDCYLYPDQRHGDNDYQHWEYTYNTTPMIHTACQKLGLESERNWHEFLDGKTGPEGAQFLSNLITELESDPTFYRLKNPANGWGSYEGLLTVLRDMMRSVPEWPTHWVFH